MTNPASVGEAAVRYRDDYIAFDSFLLPYAPPLASHQRHVYRQFPAHRFRWFEASRGGAKSYTIARYAVVDGLLRPGRKYLFAAPSFRQALHPFTYLVRLIETGGPWMDAELDGRPTRSSLHAEVTLKNGTSFVALPASGDLIRGQRGTDLVLTEFHAMKEGLYNDVIEPMLAVREGAWPNTITVETTAGFQYQFSYEERERWRREILAGDHDYCFISATVEDLRAIEFPMDWTIIDRARGRGEDRWQREYMCIWPSLAGNFYEHSILSRDEIKKGTARHSAQLGKVYVAGGDPARMEGGDDSGLSVWELDSSQNFLPVLVYLNRWNGLTADRLADEWARILKRFDVVKLVLDVRGGGQGVLDILRDKHRIIGTDEDPNVSGRRIVERFTSSPEDINEMHHAFRDASEGGRVVFPEEPNREDGLLYQTYECVDAAIEQLCNITTKVLPSGWTQFKAPSGKKKDLAYAILYGYWGVRQMQRVVAPPKRDRGSPVVESRLQHELVMGEDPLGSLVQ